jgi:hypothetical protein
MSRNTNTGGVLESMVVPSLERGGYIVSKQVHVGIRLGGKGKHKVDAVAEKGGKRFLISSKWQQTGGTAEQKVPFEVMCLAEAIKDNGDTYEKAYVVLGGDGWKLRDFYTSGKMDGYMRNVEQVKIVTLERFIAVANQGEL